MDGNNDKFTYSYSAPTESERREIDGIRKQYLPKEESKLEKLKKLDRIVNNPPKIVGIILGVVGTLIFGLGLTMCLEWNMTAWGAVVAAVGLIPAVSAYFAYKYILRSGKQKYGAEILRLSNELLGQDGKGE